MDCRIRSDDSISQMLHTWLQNSIDQAEMPLRHANGIHDSRKLIREARSYLRMAKHTIEGSDAVRVDELLRSAAQLLAPLRDVDALLDRLLEWRTDFPDSVAVVEDRLKTTQAERRSSLRDVLNIVRDKLHHSRLMLVRLKIRGGWKQLRRGHLDTYRQSRSFWHRSRASGADADLHRWRRRIKDLRHQLQLLNPIYPDQMTVFAMGWHKLSDILGEHHDLVLLHPEIGTKIEAKPMVKALTMRCAKLRHRAGRWAARLYVASPPDYERMIDQWWRGWRQS